MGNEKEGNVCVPATAGELIVANRFEVEKELPVV